MGDPPGAAVARAARMLTVCTRWLRSDARTVTVVSRGRHPLWPELVSGLRGAGRTVRWTVLDERDTRWAPMTALRGTGRPDVLVHHDPFLPGPVTPGASAQVRELLAGGVACVFVGLPHGIRTGRLATRLDEVYLAALGAGPGRMVRRAARLAGRLAGAAALDITGGDGSLLRVRPPWRIRHDFGSARVDAPVLQLPLGEVWLAVEPGLVDGDVTVAPGRTPERLRIRSGRAHGSGTRHADGGGAADALAGLGAVEVGFGINPAAPWIAGTDLCEKAAGAVHLGFGDSSLIGGTVVADEHVDVYLPTDSTAWVVRDGERNRVGAV